MRRYEEDRARTDERQARRMAHGTREGSAESRARTGWVLAGIFVVLASGLTYVVNGIVPAAIVAVLLVVGIGALLRILR